MDGDDGVEIHPPKTAGVQGYLATLQSLLQQVPNVIVQGIPTVERTVVEKDEKDGRSLSRPCIACMVFLCCSAILYAVGHLHKPRQMLSSHTSSVWAYFCTIAELPKQSQLWLAVLGVLCRLYVAVVTPAMCMLALLLQLGWCLYFRNNSPACWTYYHDHKHVAMMAHWGFTGMLLCKACTHPRMSKPEMLIAHAIYQ